MSEPELRETLERLHQELKRTHDVDDRSRELLRDVMADIQSILEETPGAAHGESLARRLQEAVGEFEETHPSLTEAVGRVVDALAKMGI